MKFIIDLRVAYVLLSSVFILSFGPFNSILTKYHHEWNFIVLALCIAVLILLQCLSSPKKLLGLERFVLFLVLAYLAVIIVITVMHWLALTSVCCVQPVNIMDQTATIWIEQNLNFAIRYMFFPVIYYLQFRMIDRLKLLFVIRVLVVITVFSGLALLLQKYFQIDALTPPFFIVRDRLGGLATDPNAFAMTAFLVLPIVYSAIFVDRIKALKAFYLLAILLLMVSIFFSGSRTGVVGSILSLVLMSAVTIALKKMLIKRNAIIIMIVTVISVLGAIKTGIIQVDHTKGEGVVSRLVKTFDKFEQNGIRGVFFNRELRGEYFVAGYSMGMQSPLAGWGAGGFYREIPNHQYLQKNIKLPARDSVLNHYLMILVDFGAIALTLNLMALLFPLILGFFAYKYSQEVKYKILILSLLLSLSIFLLMINVVPPSYFPGVLWLWGAQMAILYRLFIKNAIHKYRRFNIKTGFYFSFIVIILILVIIGSYKTTFGQKGYLARQDYNWWPYKYELGCYDVEKYNHGAFRWCKKVATLKIPVEANNRMAYFNVLALNPDIATNPVIVTYRIKGHENQQVVLADKNWQKIELTFEDNDVIQFTTGKNKKRYMVLEIKVSRSWVPKEWKINEDTRELGVAIRL